MTNHLPTPSSQAKERSKALTAIIRQEIENRHGVSFARFMELALYHPEFGYYNTPTFELGEKGDFTTAPHISPLFAQCFAHQIEQIFTQLKEKNILEFGAGSGRFAGDLLLALERLNALPTYYYICEISLPLRQKQRDFLQAYCPHLIDRIRWLDTLPNEFSGVMLANEVLDALPVSRFRIENGSVQERGVTWENNQFAWCSLPPSDAMMTALEPILELDCFRSTYESEVHLTLPAFIRSAAHALTQGVILLADYGYGQREYYHPERARGTLTCFYQHHRHDNPFLYPGLQDITAHVNFTAVIEHAAEAGCMLAGFTSQAAFLLSNRLLPLTAAAEENLDSAQQFQLHQAVKILTMPSEMGEVIKVMGLSKGINIPLAGFAQQDRRRDL